MLQCESLPASPRRLPPVPRVRSLPPIPSPLSCKACHTCITSSAALVPLSAIPTDSRTFRGFSGKASLFSETYNVTLLSPKTQLMQTGAHLLSEVQCGSCSAYLGYKIIRAVEETERWKESSYLLELAELTTHEPFHLPQTPKPNIAP